MWCDDFFRSDRQVAQRTSLTSAKQKRRPGFGRRCFGWSVESLGHQHETVTDSARVVKETFDGSGSVDGRGQRPLTAGRAGPGNISFGNRASCGSLKPVIDVVRVNVVADDDAGGVDVLRVGTLATACASAGHAELGDGAVGGAHKAVEDAVRLSEEKYCSVAAMLQKTAKISYVIEYTEK